MAAMNFEHAPDRVWIFIERLGAGIFISGIMLLASLLCLWVIRQEGPFIKMKWRMRKALNLGMFFFPVLGSLVGLTVAMEGSTKVAMCASCHEAMGPYIENMTNPENKSLAAVHFKNLLINTDQCYQCHTGYGLRGTFQAKINGLKHVYKYYVAGYDAEIMMKEDFPNKNCLDCHERTAIYVNSARHGKLSKQIASGATLCVESGCHEDVHEEPE
jgi:nitrate/TMAO reductase-like tetraheme cytochrome c subunit